VAPLPDADEALAMMPSDRFSISGRRTVEYWTEEGFDRTELLALVIAYLNERRWQKVIDAGWTDWDLQVYNNRWTVAEACTVQQNHGGNKRLIRIRYRLKTRPLFWLVAAFGLVLACICLLIDERMAGGVGAAVLVALAALWWRGVSLAGRITKVFSLKARELKLHRCKTPSAVPLRGRSEEAHGP
jgi:hypothetical protein